VDNKKIICIAEKLTLAEAAGKVLADKLGVKPEFLDWTKEAKSKQYNQVGNVRFYWLDGHAFEQAPPDHYLPDDIPRTKKGAKVWRAQDLPIFPERYTLTPKEGKERRLAMIETSLKECDVVWHMGDPDSEGQLLVEETLLQYDYRGSVKRILINDYNTSKVRAALENILDNTDAICREWYWWALARSHYSWTLGMNGTRAMTLRGASLGFEGGVLPVGDVQTPVLYIVRERDRLIEEFKAIPYYTLSGTLKHANGSFRASWKPKEDQAGLDHDGRLIDGNVARELTERLAGKTGSITTYSKEKKQEKAPLPLSMNDLQVEAFRRHGYAANDVLQAGQQLYEVYKVMSYPRSDNRYLSEAQHADAPAVMDAVFAIRPDLAGLRAALDPARKSAAFDDKRMEGTPHHGIVPSIPENPVDPSKWSEIERNVYDLVVRGYLAQFAAPYEYHQTKVEADVEGETFRASGRTPISQGWKALLPEAKDDEDGADDEKADKQTLPVMEKGDPALCEKCEQTSRKTKAPDRFDEAMLLDCMENIHKYVTDPEARKRLKEGDGIGTTATRAPMIDGMKERQLLIPAPSKGKTPKLMTSQAARALIDALPLDVKDPITAGQLKSRLDQVAKAANKESAYQAFMADTKAWVADIVARAPALQMTLPAAPGTECPSCKVGRLKRKQKAETQRWFWFCSRWNADPKCSAIFGDQDGKPDTRPQEHIACPTCQTGALRRAVKEKSAWWYCSNWKPDAGECKARYQDDKGKPDLTPPLDVDCPTCKEGKLRRKIGQNGPFWYCSRWNAEAKCSAKFHDDQGKPQLVMPEAISCPICKKGALRRMPHTGSYFWACSNYKVEEIKCPATYPDQAGRPNFAPAAKRARR
jgi:DNA topoisomerase-3